MILINLLPPELRRARRSGVSPVFLAAAAGMLIVSGLAGTWLWVEYGPIKAAEREIERLQQDLADASRRADAVLALETEIAAYEKLHANIVGMIARKVFWARTLDNFANLLAQTNGNRWVEMDDYEVRCVNLAIAPAAAAGAVVKRDRNVAETISFQFRATFRVTGKNLDKAGDYLKSFFRTVDGSAFWNEGGFAGNSEALYKGDTPQFKKEIGLVVTDLPLEWKRQKVVAAVAKPAPGGQK